MKIPTQMGEQSCKCTELSSKKERTDEHSYGITKTLTWQSRCTQ